MIKWIFSFFAVIFFAQPAVGQEGDFARCIAGLRERAKSERLPAWIVDEVMPNLSYQSRVIELDRSQPEFTQTFADYLHRRLTPERIERGRQLRDEYDLFLAELTRKYGVPGHYLIAFWGLETNYGNYLGKMPTLDCLATLACDPRRSDYFTGELMTALSLLQRESLTPDEMKGSWAGAVGHTQFMPSAYSRHAVDGDGDGTINLWQSERDALASGANFLAGLGWKTGERWGREVTLPENFPYAETGLANRKPLSAWRDLGVTMTDGTPLPDVGMKGAILVPAGHTGPAFIVYRNFDVIMRWNRSESYALSVGLLADRIAGGVSLARPPSTTESALSRRTVEKIQMRLNDLGFSAGGVDGVLGPATRSALRAFQKSTGMVADGHPDGKTLRALKIALEPSS
ncbi:MAG: lytic murein transglycosylase [Desulfobulbaceae bacterium]|nr:lytic murein transglycosylase [Desulfobulbaceae bacterium]